MERPWVRITVALAFIGFGLLLIYGGWKQPDDDGLRSLPVAIGIALPVVVYAATGFIIGRWWVVALLAIPVLLAIPAGAITADEDQFPVHLAYLWVTIMFLGPIAIAGIVARKLWERNHTGTRRAPGGSPQRNH